MTTCKNCKFWDNWDNTTQKHKEWDGLCRIKSPKISNDGDRSLYFARWPYTSSNDWCGEGQPKE